MSLKLKWILTLGAFAGIFVIPLNPVNSTFFRLAWLGCLAASWVGFTFLTWKVKPLRLAAFILPVLALTPLILPGSKIDSDELRTDYVLRMKELEGTKYFWGGESPRGIDCSGLPRRALRNALLAYGFKHFNGRAFRLYLEHWWFDASAEALGDGYRSYTTPIGTTGTIREMEYSALQPGDLAVTTNGRHVIIYVGEEKWIQAEPSEGAVIILHGRNDENGWFKSSVTTHRWRLLK